MKLTQSRLLNRMLSNKGYTIDQTILIVAIIAILITLVIVTVGWQLINRSSGTKAAAQLKQVEDANGQFFSSQRVWPSQALTAANPSAVQNMQMLVNASGLAWADNVNQGELRNLLPGFRVVGTAVNHSFGGSGGAITQQANRMGATSTDYRMVVQFADVPLSEAKEADRAIDGTEDNGQGRVTYSTAACMNPTKNNVVPTVATATLTASTVFLCYAANQVQ